MIPDQHIAIPCKGRTATVNAINFGAFLRKRPTPTSRLAIVLLKPEIRPLKPSLVAIRAAKWPKVRMGHKASWAAKFGYLGDVILRPQDNTSQPG